MSSTLRIDNQFTAHAVCAAAGMRDGLRTAHFYMRDLSAADQGFAGEAPSGAWLSRLVGGIARFADRLLSKAADACVRLFLPQWRDLPSPFAPRMVEEVTHAINENRLVLTSLFTAYFFRASRHIMERCTESPILVLEHRVDAARRILASHTTQPADRFAALAEALLTLAEARAIARHGRVKPGFDFLNKADANVGVMAAACLALLLAEGGKPVSSVNEDEFFTIAGALLAPRLPAMEQAIARRDLKSLASELRTVHDLY